ncbi:MAG: pyridoxamine 5'-phosphate oxidase family protein [Clostridia bacterium]|nr:pyridoxamine 5'-phosphate oxidase family protein [Clostridia bacterium]
MDGDLKNIIETGDAIRTAEQLLRGGDRLYAGTIGIDGRPQVRPASFAFVRDGALYFLTLKSSRMYAELSKTPFIQFCGRGGESGLSFRLSGKAVFTEDPEITEPAAGACPEVLERAGGEMKMLIVFFLTGAELLIESETPNEPETKMLLPDPSGVLIGIAVKKKTELRDRLTRVFERRETEPPLKEGKAARLYDGAMFVFAEAAKALWPRMDITPLERAAVFETYDEREKYTMLAARIIGNAVVDSPEDVTYWLDPERWTETGFEV